MYQNNLGVKKKQAYTYTYFITSTSLQNLSGRRNVKGGRYIVKEKKISQVIWFITGFHFRISDLIYGSHVCGMKQQQYSLERKAY